MYYVATHRGFLCEEEARGFYLTFDVRWATPYPTFEAADIAARIGVEFLHAKLADTTYYAILMPAASGFGSTPPEKENNG